MVCSKRHTSVSGLPAGSVCIEAEAQQSDQWEGKRGGVIRHMTQTGRWVTQVRRAGL